MSDAMDNTHSKKIIQSDLVNYLTRTASRGVPKRLVIVVRFMLRWILIGKILRQLESAGMKMMISVTEKLPSIISRNMENTCACRCDGSKIGL